MYISGLMESKSEHRCGSLESFLGWEGYECFSVFLRILMKKYWVGNRRKRFCGEMWETLFEGEGLLKIL